MLQKTTTASAAHRPAERRPGRCLRHCSHEDRDIEPEAELRGRGRCKTLNADTHPLLPTLAPERVRLCLHPRRREVSLPHLRAQHTLNCVNLPEASHTRWGDPHPYLRACGEHLIGHRSRRVRATRTDGGPVGQIAASLRRVLRRRADATSLGWNGRSVHRRSAAAARRVRDGEWLLRLGERLQGPAPAAPAGVRHRARRRHSDPGVQPAGHVHPGEGPRGREGLGSLPQRRDGRRRRPEHAGQAAPGEAQGVHQRPGGHRLSGRGAALLGGGDG